MKADDAYRLACEGTALLWRGDFQNARQLSKAVASRIDRKPRRASDDPAKAFHLHRQTQGRRAQILGMLLIPLDADLSIPLRRAPDAQVALTEAFGITGELRFARCVTSSARSALTSGTAKVFSSRLSTHECIPPSECSHPSAGSMSILSRLRHCRRRNRLSTSAPAPAFLLPYWRSAVSRQ